MKIIRYPEKQQWAELLQRPVQDSKAISETVLPILQSVQKDGDRALRTFSEQFDKVALSDFCISKQDIELAEQKLDEQLIRAIKLAADNITKFHRAQLKEVAKIETSPGVLCWQKSLPIEKVGLYIPGGTAPLFSTVLMLGIPAKLAGCSEIVLCTPPDKNGNVHPAILYAAGLAGIHKIYKVGGAQAIAAMAYGTETIPKVYKIFGPGNQYVTAAKQLVGTDGVAIDMPAGPSEVAVVADASANPQFIAADLLSQAEHGADSQVLLITTNEAVINKSLAAIENQLKDLPRREIALAALKNSRAVLLKSLDEVMELVNDYAPEHLILMVETPQLIADKVKNAGSVFLGAFTPESAGDYASGTNHTLPTNGYARSFSGVSMDSFMKKITFQEISKEGLNQIGSAIEIMAEAEELTAHKQAVSVRLAHINQTGTL